MSALKELVDLYKHLKKTITDNKTRELLLPYHEKALEVQRENLDERERIAEVLRASDTRHTEEVQALNARHTEEVQALNARHTEEVSKLKTENSLLVAENSALHVALNAKRTSVIATFSEKTGTHIEESTGHHYCSKCFAQEKYSPMQDTGTGRKCSVCGSVSPDPDRPSLYEFRTPI